MCPFLTKYFIRQKLGNVPNFGWNSFTPYREGRLFGGSVYSLSSRVTLKIKVQELKKSKINLAYAPYYVLTLNKPSVFMNSGPLQSDSYKN